MPDETEMAAFEEFISGIDTTKLVSIAVYGYCDDSGDKKLNDTLSLKRAKYAQDYMTGKGIGLKFFAEVKGHGKINTNKKAEEEVSEEMSFNRRATIYLTYRKEEESAVIDAFKKELKVGDMLTFNNIYFEGDRHVLLGESYPVLDSLVHTLKANPGYHVIILGHVYSEWAPQGVDALDIDTGKKELSKTRAKEIYEYLIDNGIDAERLAYKGMMDLKPLHKKPHHDRRVELQVTKVVK